jgi:Tol biopolymer transport system component
VGPASEPERIFEALRAMGISGGAANANEPAGALNAHDETALVAKAWSFADGRGDPTLIHYFMRRFPGEDNAPLFALLASVLAGLAIGIGFFMLMPARKPVRVTVAAGGADGAYVRMMELYNAHLKPLGVELVAQDQSSSGFGNVQMLAEGKVAAAFIKGGFAGALRDPDYMHDERIKSRGKDWEHDWTARLSRFQSLGRVSLEPLWVFTYGSSETHRLNELNSEPIHVGSMESGTRTLAALLLESNGVRFKPGLWLDNPMKPPKIGEPRPLGEARALFLQQPAETAMVQALLKNLAPEKQHDKSRIVRAAAFSPRGGRIAVALGDQTLRVWNSTTGKETALLKGHTDEINDVAFSPDGTRIVSGGDDDKVRVWDAATGAQIAEFPGSGKDINSVAYSPDGKLIVSASDSDRATVRDAVSGVVVRYLTGHEDDVNSAAFSPDGKRVVTASRDGTAIVYNAETGAPQHVLAGHEKAVSSAQFSHDGKLIVTASWDGTARIWDATTGRTRLILAGHTDLVRGAEFSPDNSKIITASWDDTARVWDVATGTMIRVLNGLRSNVNSVGFSPDGKLAMTASQDAHVRLWDTTTWANAADFTLEGTAAAKGHGVQRSLHLLNFATDAEAYVARYPFLASVQVPKGAIALEPHIPAETVTLLSTTVAFVVDKVWADQNRSVVRAITDAIVHKPLPGIDETTRKPRMFFRSGQFPNINDPEYDVSPIAAPIYKSGDLPFLLGKLARISWIPFGVAAWIDEHAGTLVLSLLPVLGLLVPLIRAVPAIYNWTVRRRILYWYRRLQALERRLDFEERIAHPVRTTPEIDRIDSAVSKIQVPLNYSDQYYDLRAHIELVRQRLATRISAPGAGPPASRLP